MSWNHKNHSWHFAPESRAFPNGPEVATIGYIREKKEFIRKPFETINFSFILSGSGIFQTQDESLKVLAPMVLVQQPGLPMYYGPEGTWEELYIIYPAKCSQYFESRSYFKSHSPFWTIHNKELLYKLLEKLKLSLMSESSADTVDFLVEEIIRGSFSGQSPDHTEEGDTNFVLIKNAQKKIDQNLSVEPDWLQISTSLGLHLTKFRRLWKQYFKQAPGAYFLEQRMNRARRDLIETQQTAREIAQNLGFRDELYFYRSFKKATGMSSKEYRERYRNVV